MSEEARIEKIYRRHLRAEQLARPSDKTSYPYRYAEDVGYLLEHRRILLKRVEELEAENERLRKLIEKQDAKVAEIRSGGQW